MELRIGMQVKHLTLGVGKVVALDAESVHVVFATHDARQATKLRLPKALEFLGPSESPNAWLAGLTGFTLDEGSRRYRRATTWLSHAQALERFEEAFPGGFAGAAYRSQEPGRADRPRRWRRAGAEYAALLGDGQGERLLEAGDVAGLVERACKVERIVRSLQREAEGASLEARLAHPGRAAAYFERLFEFIAAARPHRARFEALAAAVAALDPAAPAEAGWPLVTLLPFVARPDLYLVLRPRFACDVAQRLGLELAYDAEPNWVSYTSFLSASGELLEQLAPLGARDLVDVEVFMHVVLAKTARPRPVAAQEPSSSEPSLAEPSAAGGPAVSRAGRRTPGRRAATR